MVSICTVDMELAHQDEFPTLETLNFATRIKKIPLAPKTMEVRIKNPILWNAMIKTISFRLPKINHY
jgi:hypothetical protein